MFRLAFKDKRFAVGFCIVMVVLLVAVFATVLAPNNPNEVNLSLKNIGPCLKYPLGTDTLGRCELSRIIYGCRNSIFITIPALAMLSFIGLVLGSLCAVAQGTVDRIISFIANVFMSFPSLMVGIVVVGVLGNSYQGVVITIIISLFAWFTRMVRSIAIVEMGKDYIVSARIAGASSLQIVMKHLIPNILPQFLVYISSSIASSILMVSGFSFIGLGLGVGESEWGAMLDNAKTVIYSNPILIVYPGLCILITAIGFTLLGEGISKAFGLERE